MTKDWNKYKAVEVLSDKDENGNRLLSLFAKDYKDIMGLEVCPSCGNFQEKFNNLLKKTTTMQNTESKNSGYQLKSMFENITLHGGNQYYNNQNLTDDVAKMLIEKHPKGIDLFSKIPKKTIEKTTATKTK